MELINNLYQDWTTTDLEWLTDPDDIFSTWVKILPWLYQTLNFDIGNR